ncbi:peptidase inhibitor family I36 protein [Streptomyces laurentii]|uniref:peptidase inhibitor family I36 protein n=1 Tax=Streptomyces laurentii TaxID=39478 RepID=UPI0034072729
MNHRAKFTLSVIAGAFGAALALAPAAPAAVAVPADGYDSCKKGYICFFSEKDGEGQKCQWSANATDARSMCSWMKSGTNTRSVYNRTGGRFHYYHRANYVDRIGSTTAGDKGNLAGTYTIGSLCTGSCPS